MPRGYEKGDEGRKHSALNAIELSVHFLAENGWISPAKPRDILEEFGEYIERVMEISKEECKRIFEQGPEELQSLYLVKTCCAYDIG